MRSPSALLLLCVGCAPSAAPTFGTGGTQPPDAWLNGWYQDWFSETWELCGRPDAFLPWDPMPVQYVVRGPYEALVDEACIYRILDDLKLDYEAEYAANPELSYWKLYGLALPAYALLSLDHGTIAALQERVADGQDGYLTPPFVEELATIARLAGETEVRPVLYNFVMSSMLETIWDRDIPDGTVAWVDIPSRTLHVQPPASEEYLTQASFLIHEATHLWRQQDHVPCKAGCWGGSDRKCDEDFQGAYGYGAGMAELLWDHLPWEDDPEWAAQHDMELGYTIDACYGHIIEVCYNPDYEM